jgi:hypothetical protein
MTPIRARTWAKLAAGGYEDRPDGGAPKRVQGWVDLEALFSAAGA